jgi:DNA polymerase sigma
MVTENQLNLSKLMAAVTARQRLKNAKDSLNDFRHVMEDLKADIGEVEELDHVTKENFLKIDLQLYEMLKYISLQDEEIRSKKFKIEMDLFNALGVEE